MFFTNQSNNQGFFQIYIDDQVKITKDTEIIVQFQQNHLFKLDLLSATLKHPNADLKNIQKKQVKIRRPATIYDCLDQFRKSDRIAEWRCSECRNEGGQKKMTIYNAPRVLIVYLKRFQSNISADGNSIIQNKISDIVKFQPHLYLQKYVEKQQLPMWKGSHLLNYRLVSVANHMQLNSKKVQLGHYYAFVVNRHSWYLCNDESIQELQNLDYLSSGEAYYMIYQRIM